MTDAAAPVARRLAGSLAMLWVRGDVPRTQSMEHWRGPHAQIVARQHGLEDYRQHHFDPDGPGLWPATEGIDTSLPVEDRMDGTPEVHSRLPVPNPRGIVYSLRHVFPDEANAFSRTLMNSTSGRGATWYSTADPGRTGFRTVVLVRVRDEAKDLSVLTDELAPALAGLPGITEVRAQVWTPWKAWAWNTPGVRHDNPTDTRYSAVLIVGARDRQSLETALRSGPVAALAGRLSTSVAALHAYPVAATYHYVKEGRVTLPQLSHARKPPLAPVRRHVTPGPGLPEPTRAFPSGQLVPLPGEGPEDVVVGADGALYCGLAGGDVVRHDPEAGTTAVVARTGGRPLGLESLPDGRLLVCDAHRGLLRVDPSSGAVETLVQYVDDVPLRFCSNAVVGLDGTIWFTESTSRFDFEHYVGAFLEQRPSGRLFRRDPDGTVEVVLDRLHFSNGLSLTPDGAGLIYAETVDATLSRLHLTGPRQGETQELVSDMPGYPDNLSTFVDGAFWVALPDARDPKLAKAAAGPGILRKLAWRLPERLQPVPTPIIWVQSYDQDGALLHDLHGQRDDFHGATGVAQHGRALYLASPARSALLRLDLPEPPVPPSVVEPQPARRS